MKFPLCASSFLLLAICGTARAQNEGQLSAPPEEIITDFGIDEYLAVPKYTLTLGMRTVGGAKSSFTGRGYVSSFQPTGDITTPNINRIYHDGNVLQNTEGYFFVTGNNDGSTTTHTADPTPAGYTNTWTYTDPLQRRDDGNLDFHSYAADVADSGTHVNNPKRGSGVDLTLSRDIGNLGKRIELKLLIGASLADIKSHASDTLQANITTITDTYVPLLAHDQTSVPAPPYTAPSFSQTPQVGDDGLPLFDSTGTQIIIYTETTVYMTNVPMMRTITSSTGTVFNTWDMRGAYFTFRLGPSLTFLITDRFKATLAAGLSMVYAGTNYNVVQSYQPVTADPVISTVTDEEGKFLPGYFVDATLQFDFTDRAGLYAGVGMQDNGSYTQTAILNDTLTGSHADYKALVDLSNLSGFRMGMTFRF